MSENMKAAGAAADTEDISLVMSVFNQIIYNPMNLGLVIIIVFLIYKIIKDRFEVPAVGGGSLAPAEPELPKLRRDFTVQELREFDGNQADGRVLVAVNGNVYDVTKGKRFYGPGGPYASFAGRDASRNLATFDVAPNTKEEYDDLSDLSAVQMDSVREWEMQFKEKYDYVGKLLRKGEQPTNYDEEEDEETTSNSTTEQKETEKLDSAADSKIKDADDDAIRKRNVSSAMHSTSTSDPVLN